MHRDINIESTSNKIDQIDNKDDRYSMLTDNDSTIVMEKKHEKAERECSYKLEKREESKMHEGKTIVALEGEVS